MGDRYLRLPCVIDRTGVARSTIYLWIKQGHFPRPAQLGPRSVAWLESEIDSWIADRADQREDKNAA